jgi:DUF3047 family protein
MSAIVPAARIVLCLAVVGGGFLVAGPVSAQVQSVEEWTSQSLNKTGTPAGWEKVLPVLTSAKVEVIANGAERVLHLKSTGDHSIIAKDLSGVNLAATPWLEWTWRVDALPRGANLEKKEQGDSAAEIHLVWKAGNRILGYAWDETLSLERFFENPRQAGVYFLIVTSGKAQPGKWISMKRHVIEDYKKVFNAEPPGPPDRIAISIDSNQTRSTAESYIGAIRFRGR